MHNEEPGLLLGGSTASSRERAQLLDLGFNGNAIHHRVARGRLHRVGYAVYAVGRPELSRYGRWMAAVLSCGTEAVLSHRSAAALWEILPTDRERTDVSVPIRDQRRRSGIAVHRRLLSSTEITRWHRIPVTTPICTLIDIAARVQAGQLEAAVNQADKLGLVDPEALRPRSTR